MDPRHDVDLADNAKWIHENSATIYIKQIKGHTDSIVSCQFICDDMKIFTISRDNSVRIWCCFTGKELNCFRNLHSDVITGGKANNNSTNWDNTVKYWSIRNGAKLWENTHDYLVSCCNISRDDTQIVSVSDVDFVVKIWCADTGDLIQKILDIHNNTMTSISFTPNGDRILTCSMDKKCKVYDLKSNSNTITLSGHDAVVSDCSISDGERFITTVSWDKTMRIWDISTGAYRLKGPTIRENGHNGSISCCKISPDNSMIITAGYDKRLVIWDIEMAVPKIVLQSHTNWINDIDISKDGKWVISVAKDEDILMWKITDCDKIKMVIEKKARLHVINTKCSKCEKTFMVEKIKKVKKGEEEKLLCVFCRTELRSKGKVLRAQEFWDK